MPKTRVASFWIHRVKQIWNQCNVNFAQWCNFYWPTLRAVSDNLRDKRGQSAAYQQK